MERETAGPMTLWMGTTPLSALLGSNSALENHISPSFQPRRKKKKRPLICIATILSYHYAAE